MTPAQLNEWQDRRDVAALQLSVFRKLAKVLQDRQAEDEAGFGEGTMHVAQAVRVLETELVDISNLYNKYADAYHLNADCLHILAECDHEDSAVVEQVCVCASGVCASPPLFFSRLWWLILPLFFSRL